VIADRDEHGIGCQISNMFERVAQVSVDDDRIRLGRRHGIDQCILRSGDRDDVEPTRPQPSLHAAYAARRDDAEPVARRLEDRGWGLWWRGKFDDRHGRGLRLTVASCRKAH
jgi:hypothetical protein